MTDNDKNELPIGHGPAINEIKDVETVNKMFEQGNPPRNKNDEGYKAPFAQPAETPSQQDPLAKSQFDLGGQEPQPVKSGFNLAQAQIDNARRMMNPAAQNEGYDQAQRILDAQKARGITGDTSSLPPEPGTEKTNPIPEEPTN